MLTMKLIKVKEYREGNEVPAKKDICDNPSFHQSVGFALTYGQCFGMLPVDGVLAYDENQVKFRWKSIKTIYSMVFLFCGTVESYLGISRLLRLGFKINFAEGLLFFIAAILRASMLFRLARKWNFFIKRWRECEDPFLKAPYRIKGWSLSRKINILFAILALLSISKLKSKLIIYSFIKVFMPFQAEHFFFLAVAVSDNHLQILYCTPKSSIFWDNFLSRYRPHLRHSFPYSPYQLPVYEVSI